MPRTKPTHRQKSQLARIIDTRPINRLTAAIAIVLVGISGYVYLSAHAFAAPTASNRDTRAALAVAQLHSWYNTSAYQTTGWWQSANALAATIDYMQATGSRAYLPDVQNFYNAHASTNFIINKYYDDEGWWALTWIKAYNLTGNTAYLNTAKAIFTNMTGGWDATCGGGVWWTTDKTYKNAIPNELFLDLATQLHSATPGDTSYENWAAQEWNWFKNSGLINSSNLVNDGLTTTCQNNGQTTWTYNQGVILGGLVGQSKISGDPTLLTQAQAIASAVISSPTLSPNGILTEPCEPTGKCGGDNAMFKGIFMQNLALLDTITPNSSYESYLKQNADSMWTKDLSGGNQLGLHWAGPFDSADAARQASGLYLLNTQLVPQTTITTSAAPIYSGLFGFCLDDYANFSTTNNKVDLYSCNGSSAQKWQVTSAGKITINGKCLDIYQAAKANGSKVDINPCNSSASQTWQVLNTGTIYNPYSGKCLDDPGWSKTNGTQLDIWTCNGGTNQIWYPAS